MRKFYLTALLISTFSFFASASEEVGTWQFVAFEPDSGQDLSKAASISRFMAGQTYEFDGTRYRMSWKFKVEIGDYLTDDSEQITFKSDNAADHQVKSFRQTHVDTLHLGFDNKVAGTLIFARTSSAIPTLPQNNNLPTVAIEAAQLHRKWKLDSISAKGDSISIHERKEIEPFLSASFSRRFNAGGTYVDYSTVKSAQGKGSWELNDGKDAIVFNRGAIDQKNYFIVECTDQRLVLLDRSKKQWCYSVVE